MKLYLSGPMRGLPRNNVPAFDKAAAELRAAGYEVVSPVEMDRNSGLDPEQNLDDMLADKLIERDLALMPYLNLDGVAVLPGWEHSVGAKQEFALALKIGIQHRRVHTWLMLSAKKGEGKATDVNCLIPSDPRLVVDAGGRLAFDAIQHEDPEADELSKASVVTTTPLELTLSSPDKTIRTNSRGGKKDDVGKLRWGLLPIEQVEEVVRTLTHGSAKYGDDNWKKVAPWQYIDAHGRHIAAWLKGEKKDPGSKTHHLANAICCLLFLMWHDEHPVSAPRDAKKEG